MEKKKIKLNVTLHEWTVGEYLTYVKGTVGGGTGTYIYDDMSHSWEKKPSKSKHIRLK